MSNLEESGHQAGKIALGSEGLGTVSPDVVEERARELARTDGRAEVNGKDRQQARDELLGGGPAAAAPELADPELENLTSWDGSLDESGVKVPNVGPEDEANIAEQLVEEGVAEADHSSRVSAAEAYPLEEEGGKA